MPSQNFQYARLNSDKVKDIAFVSLRQQGVNFEEFELIGEAEYQAGGHRWFLRYQRPLDKESRTGLACAPRVQIVS